MQNKIKRNLKRTQKIPEQVKEIHPLLLFGILVLMIIITFLLATYSTAESDKYAKFRNTNVDLETQDPKSLPPLDPIQDFENL